MSTEALLLYILIATVLFLMMAIGALAVLAYAYLTLKRRMPYLVQEAHVAWREKEIETIRREQTEIANKMAIAQLQFWKEQELESIRKQQFELARDEALVQLEQWKTAYALEIRQDAIQKSQSVTIGKVTEHFVPFLPDFTYNPKDARFLGSPVDFVVFDGLDSGEVRDIVFIEVKTGSSSLSQRERRIRDAVQSGRVQWVELHPKLDNNIAALGQVDTQSALSLEASDDANTGESLDKSKSISSDRLRLFLKSK